MNTAEKINIHVTLQVLLEGLGASQDELSESATITITGVQLDSRLLQKGDLFLACFGRNHDARDYIEEAIDSGVAAVFADSGGRWHGVQIIRDTPVIAIDNLPAKISEIAARFYSRPSEKLTVIGITGTNGKTSCSHFIAQALTEMDFKCGVIGTLGYGTSGALKETQLTTPDAVFTQMALAEMVEDGVDPVVMEVSSVGLHQKRVKRVHFDTAIFTNLTRDHLDYHKNMESYGENKKKLFTASGLRHAIVNLDDPYALSILNSIGNEVEVSTYSIKSSMATVYAKELTLTRQGFEATVCTPFGEGRVRGKLIGFFNFSNLLAVIAALISFLSRSGNVDLPDLLQRLSALKPVDGRMEIVGQSDDITAVVDYAHTPDGLRSALQGVKDHFDGKIWCVFGCGGNRDKGKRPMMGEIAEQHADRLIIADDNPRNEQGDEIVEHILSGVSNREVVTVLRDRAKAIDFAIENADVGDVILVAGKGHETYQDIGGNKLIFSDANQVRLALQKRNKH